MKILPPQTVLPDWKRKPYLAKPLYYVLVPLRALAWVLGMVIGAILGGFYAGLHDGT